MSDPILVSVVIPVKNGSSSIGACLDALFNQTIAAQMEVIIIDSGSQDDTLGIVKKYPVKLLTIDPLDFNHGLTRNQGVEQAHGKFIYFTVQDARLAVDNALEKMLLCFQDEQVVGVCGNQGVPHDKDKNPATWYKPVSLPAISRRYFGSRADFEKLAPLEQVEVCAWDNVNAMYRKAILQQQPFVRTDFAEDMIWAKNALLNGCCLVKDPGVVTWHYHHRSFNYEFSVSMIVAYCLYKEFTYVPVYPPVKKRMLQVTKRLIKEPAIGLAAKCYWFVHNLIIIAADYKAVFIARKSIRKGGTLQLELACQKYCATVPQGKLKN